MDNFNSTPHELGWDDLISEEGGQYIALDGDYTFTVKAVEKGRFAGSAKIPACNKATITLAVDHPDGVANVKYDLILWSTLEWRISDFLLAIGQKRHGEPTRPNWNAMVGARGKATF